MKKRKKKLEISPRYKALHIVCCNRKMQGNDECTMARSRISKNMHFYMIPARFSYPTSGQKSRLKLSNIILTSPRNNRSRRSVPQLLRFRRLSRRWISSETPGTTLVGTLRGPYERRTASTMGTERKSNVTHMTPFKTAPSAERFILTCNIMPHDQKRNGILTNRVITVRSTTSWQPLDRDVKEIRLKMYGEKPKKDV